MRLEFERLESKVDDAILEKKEPLEATTNAIQALNAKLTKVNHEIECLKSGFREASKELMEVKSHERELNAALKKEHEKTATELDQSNLNINSLNVELHSARDESQELRDKLKEANGEIEHLKSRWKEEITELLKSHERELNAALKKEHEKTATDVAPKQNIVELLLLVFFMVASDIAPELKIVLMVVIYQLMASRRTNEALLSEMMFLRLEHGQVLNVLLQGRQQEE